MKVPPNLLDHKVNQLETFKKNRLSFYSPFFNFFLLSSFFIRILFSKIIHNLISWLNNHLINHLIITSFTRIWFIDFISLTFLTRLYSKELVRFGLIKLNEFREIFRIFSIKKFSFLTQRSFNGVEAMSSFIQSHFWWRLLTMIESEKTISWIILSFKSSMPGINQLMTLIFWRFRKQVSEIHMVGEIIYISSRTKYIIFDFFVPTHVGITISFKLTPAKVYKLYFEGSNLKLQH